MKSVTVLGNPVRGGELVDGVMSSSTRCRGMWQLLMTSSSRKWRWQATRAQYLRHRLAVGYCTRP